MHSAFNLSVFPNYMFTSLSLFFFFFFIDIFYQKAMSSTEKYHLENNHYYYYYTTLMSIEVDMLTNRYLDVEID